MSLIRVTKWKKLISIFMMFLLAISSSLGSTYAASSNTGDQIERTTLHQEPGAKIDEKLAKQFNNSDYVSYLVKMKTQVDTASVSQKALEKASKQKATAAAAKLSARNSVVSSLRETAEQTQDSLDSYLQEQQTSGNVKSYKSFFIVNAMAVTSTKKVMEEIANHPEVEIVAPDETVYLNAEQATNQADPAASPQTGISDVVGTDSQKDEGQSSVVAPAGNDTVEWNIAQINVPEVWGLGIDGTGVVVANLDSGVDYTHPALKRKWRGLNVSGEIEHPELSWYDPINHSSLPDDHDEHGTHTMGTMVGSEENGTNQIGVAPGAKWIAVKVFQGNETSESILIDGGQWLLAPRDDQGHLHPELAPDVVNNSWGGSGMDEFFRQVVQAWYSAGIFPEFSAGNTGNGNSGGPGSVANPANYPESFATGATDANDNLADFSLLGPSPYGEIKPEVSAPGVNIRSSIPGGYTLMNGTSMAGPHTAALAALLLQANSALTVDQLEEIIKGTATPSTNLQYPISPNNGFGYGIINALRAVNTVIDGGAGGTISGQVITDGEDLEAPVLEHEPVKLSYLGEDIPLTVHVTDNVSVTNVDIFVRPPGKEDFSKIYVSRKSGDYKNGIYTAFIPESMLTEPGELEYYIKVNDFGNNGFQTEVNSVQIETGIKPGYLQNFENDTTGFEYGGDGKTWKWGVPESGPGKAYSGEKVLATNLTGTSAPGSLSYVISPPIDLTESPDGAILSYKQWYNLQLGDTFGKVYISSTQSDYEFEQLSYLTGTNGDWKNRNIDLTQYGGQMVRIAFVFDSTPDDTTSEGWYLDDFQISDLDHEAPEAPSNLIASTSPFGYVDLNWEPSADDDLRQYIVYRSEGEGGSFEPIGTSNNTHYLDTIPGNNSAFTYAVSAEDLSHNMSAMSNEVAVTAEGQHDIYYDTFDSADDNGWTHNGENDDWERGIPNYINGPSSVVSLPNVWGTNLSGDYNSGMGASLVTPVIDLTEASHPAMTFRQWFDLENYYDVGYVEASTDGGTKWDKLDSYTGYSVSWSPYFIDLSPYSGSKVQFRFHFITDPNTEYGGWYLDNFRVVDVGDDNTDLSKFLDNIPNTAVMNEVNSNVNPIRVMPKDEPASKLNLARVVPLELPITHASSVSSLSLEPKEGIDVTDGSLGLPVRATVTTLETGRSVNTDPATGKFSFFQKAGSYTLKTEAYGYYSQTKSATLTDSSAATLNFNLVPIPHGKVHGIITDEESGEPVAGVLVSALEDAAVSPVRTAADGSFTIDLLEGNYNLAVDSDRYFYKSIPVIVAGNADVNVAATLEKFVGYSDELAYDNGVAVDGWYLKSINDAFAVRFTPKAEGAWVTGATLNFWYTQSGNDIKYALYDATGPDGAPGKLISGPYNGKANNGKEWTTVAFDRPIAVSGDFYIVYIQSNDGIRCPRIAINNLTDNNKNAMRTWIRKDGIWKSPYDTGANNILIHAQMKYAVDAPILSSTAPNHFTNQDQITVTGATTARDGSAIRVYHDSVLSPSVTVTNKQFSVPITLHDGENVVTAEADVLDRTTKRSEPLKITLDKISPKLTVSSPIEGTATNSEVVLVSGTATDEHFKELTVNGQSVQVGSNGSFSYRMMVDEGSNTITVKAMDLAGNESVVSRTIDVSRQLPKLTNIKPAEDVHILTGATVLVSFDSSPKLTASFKIELPTTMKTAGNTDFSMTETSKGHYEGTYKSTASLNEGGIVVISATDASGNTAVVDAPGRLYVSNPTSTYYPSAGNTDPISNVTPTPTPNPAPLPSPVPMPSPTPVSVPVFTDLGSVLWAKPAIEELAARGILTGISENTFAPLKNLTRAEFTAMLVRAYGLSGTGAANPFTDVNPGNWYASAITTAAQAGIVNGTGDGKFEPNREITREEMAVMAASALKHDHALASFDKKAVLAQFNDKDKIASFAQESVAQLTKIGALAGVEGGLFAPKSLANRAQAAVIIQRLLQRTS